MLKLCWFKKKIKTNKQNRNKKPFKKSQNPNQLKKIRVILVQYCMNSIFSFSYNQTISDTRRPKSSVTNSWYIKKAQKNQEERARSCDVDSPFIDSFSNMFNDGHAPLSPYSGTVFENYVNSNLQTPYPSRQHTPAPPTDLQNPGGDKIFLDNSKKRFTF